MNDAPGTRCGAWTPAEQTRATLWCQRNAGHDGPHHVYGGDGRPVREWRSVSDEPGTLAQAEDLGRRTLARIARDFPVPTEQSDADRERVASDLRAFRRAEEGLRASTFAHPDLARQNAHHARRYAEERADAWASLVRTGELYGEKP